LAYPPTTAASKSTLQHIQHHAAPFFRCALLSGDTPYPSNEASSESDLDLTTDPAINKEKSDETCHHIHHSSGSALVGFLCATRCQSTPELYSSILSEDGPPQSSDGHLPHSYPTKHQPNGPFLVIHSIVVQKEYQRQGVGRALLEYFIKSVTVYNAELDEGGKNRRRNKIKALNSHAKIEKIVLVCCSSIANLFISAGFRWKATIKGGIDPLYELEREVDPSPIPDAYQSMVEHDCFLVDAFTIPGERGSGTPAAIVVLHDSPTNLLDDVNTISYTPKGYQDSAGLLVAAERGEKWMSSISKEFNQPVTAFVWPISIAMSRRGSNASSISEDELNLSVHDERRNPTEPQPEMHYAIRVFTGSGVEIFMCSHAVLAAASVLFHHNKLTRYIEERRTACFHFMDEVTIESPLNISSHRWPSQTLQVFGTMHLSGIRIEMNCPWRTVDPLPLGPEDEGAVLSIFWSSFIWDDHAADELALTSPMDYVRFVGVTSDGEDLFVELTAEGFDMVGTKILTALHCDNDGVGVQEG
jgi:GNAT superfamily N-acetyltransferase